jgi:hypothetical protein
MVMEYDVDDIKALFRISQGAWEDATLTATYPQVGLERGIVNGEVGGSFKKNQATGFEYGSFLFVS